MAHTADVRLKRGDADVEVYGPRVVDDAVGRSKQLGVLGPAKPEVRLREMDADKVDLCEVGAEATGGADGTLARSTAVGTAVHGNDARDVTRRAEAVEKIGAERAGGAREKNRLALVQGGRLVGGGRQILRVLFHEELRLFNLARCLVTPRAVAPGLGEEMAGQASRSRVCIDDTRGQSIGGDGDVCRLDAAPQDTRNGHDLLRVDADGEQVRVWLHLCGADLGHEQGHDGLRQRFLAPKVERDGFLRIRVVGVLVQGVYGRLVRLESPASLDGALGCALEGEVWIRHGDETADYAAVGNRGLVGLLNERPHVVNESLGLGVVLGHRVRLEDESRLEPILADDQRPLDGRVARKRVLDGDGIQLLPRRKDNNVVAAAVVDPVVGQGRMRLKQVARRPLGQLGKGVEDRLAGGVSRILAADKELVDALFGVDAAPVCAHDVAVEDKVLPQVPALLEVERIGHHSRQCVSAAELS
ncbi:hypothetical protein G6O67_005097 [Ophiocordyceps sinensis]|uniref:Uncharacterized protein n=1 Tax=Ophiocordyceps sinensis TaxID=72228 RepID=A0A8H4V5J2_9HYPO|nr:hypothetical protein G6O67_005097 [Ophiocordyceps sinensis]